MEIIGMGIYTIAIIFVTYATTRRLFEREQLKMRRRMMHAQRIADEMRDRLIEEQVEWAVYCFQNQK